MKNFFKALALLLLPLAAIAQNQPPSVNFGNNNPLTYNYAGSNPRLAAIPVYGSGELVVFASGVSGSPAGCAFFVGFYGQFYGGVAPTGVIPSAGAGGSVNISGNGVFFYHVIISNNGTESGPFSTVALGYSCTTYPTNGTAFVEFIPDTVPPLVAAHITTNATFQLKTQPAIVGLLTINQAGTGETISIFDNTACSGTAVAILTGFASGQSYPYNVSTGKALCVLTSGGTAGDYTLTYR